MEEEEVGETMGAKLCTQVRLVLATKAKQYMEPKERSMKKVYADISQDRKED